MAVCMCVWWPEQNYFDKRCCTAFVTHTQMRGTVQQQWEQVCQVEHNHGLMYTLVLKFCAVPLPHDILNHVPQYQHHRTSVIWHLQLSAQSVIMFNMADVSCVTQNWKVIMWFMWQFDSQGVNVFWLMGDNTPSSSVGSEPHFWYTMKTFIFKNKVTAKNKEANFGIYFKSIVKSRKKTANKYQVIQLIMAQSHQKVAHQSSSTCFYNRCASRSVAM